MIDSKSGIYRIINRENGREYIGSAIDLFHRKAVHFSQLRTGKHSNKALQFAWNKYSEDAFVFQIISNETDKFRLVLEEQKEIDKAKNKGVRLYNIRPLAMSQFGFRHSQETKKKMSESRKGKILGQYSKERIEKTRASLIGRIAPNKGKPMSEEQKVKLRGRISLLKGIPRSEKVKEKISKTRMGIIPWNKGMKRVDRHTWLSHKEALMWLDKRTEDRKERGVEGKHLA